jgi:hypothetical protein
VKREVLAELEAWAGAEFDELELVHRSTERYEITPIRLPQ